MYRLFDENGEYMRWVSRKEEALGLLASHPDWTMKFVRRARKVVDLSQFEEAPF
jgi:hypothetical protein